MLLAAVDHSFYYDFYVPQEPIVEDDLKAIKKEMEKIIKKDYPITREEISREEARSGTLKLYDGSQASWLHDNLLAYFIYRSRIEALNEPYKLEILDSIKTEPITIYHVGDQWWDLCAGPHVESTGQLNSRAIELQSLAGAYWRGDEKNAMLQVVHDVMIMTPVSTQSLSLSYLSVYHHHLYSGYTALHGKPKNS